MPVVIQKNPIKHYKSIKTGNGADERAGDASLFGGAARASKDGDWSESYICNLFDWHLKEQETMPWLRALPNGSSRISQRRYAPIIPSLT